LIGQIANQDNGNHSHIAGSNPVWTPEPNWRRKNPVFDEQQLIGRRVLAVPASGGTMAELKNQSDLDLLSDTELLTIQEVAKLAKVSTKSICRWIESGKITVVKFGERTLRNPARSVIAQLRASGYDRLINDI